MWARMDQSQEPQRLVRSDLLERQPRLRRLSLRRQLERLEDEQREFKEFLARLRFAKDRAEFDQFMAERRFSALRAEIRQAPEACCRPTRTTEVCRASLRHPPLMQRHGSRTTPKGGPAGVCASAESATRRKSADRHSGAGLYPPPGLYPPRYLRKRRSAIGAFLPYREGAVSNPQFARSLTSPQSLGIARRRTDTQRSGPNFYVGAEPQTRRGRHTVRSEGTSSPATPCVKMRPSSLRLAARIKRSPRRRVNDRLGRFSWRSGSA